MSSRSRALFCALAIPLAASPSLASSPMLVRGPAIVGVTSSTAYVSWETSEHQASATLSWGTSPGLHPNQAVDPNNAEKHSVQLSGLAGGQTIYFTIDSDPAAEESSFTTAPQAAQTAPFRFVVYGDNRTDTSDHQLVADAINQESGIAFLVQTGDMAQNYPAGISGGDEWDSFFQVEHALLRTHPLFATIGNHETLDGLDHWSEFFSPPGFSNASAVHYYSADWAQVHLAAMDVFETSIPDINAADSISDAQLEWLKADLDDAKSRGQLSFVSIHHGPYSHATGSSAHGGSALVLAEVVPELVSRGAIAVFAGHDHLYERGCNGEIDYFVVGGGGAPLYPVDATAAGVLHAESSLSYAVITVAGRQVSGVAKKPDGTVIDSFSLPTTGCTHLAVADAGTPGSDGGIADAGSNDAPDAGTGAGSSSCASLGTDAAWPFLPAAALIVLRRRRRNA